MKTYIYTQLNMLEDEFFQVCQRLEKEGFPTSKHVPEVDYFLYFDIAYKECHFWNQYFQQLEMDKMEIIDFLEGAIPEVEEMEENTKNEAILDVLEEMLYIVKQCC